MTVDIKNPDLQSVTDISNNLLPNSPVDRTAAQGIDFLGTFTGLFYYLSVGQEFGLVLKLSKKRQVRFTIYHPIELQKEAKDCANQLAKAFESLN